MSKRRKSKNRSENRRGPENGATKRSRPENRAAEAMTVAWALSIVAVSAAEIIAIIAYALAVAWVSWGGDKKEITPSMLALPTLFLMIASVTGIVCLVLTVVVGTMRKSRPPKAVTVFAVIVGAAPLVGWGVLMIAN